jgi:ankyrin repeat protein
MMLAAKGDANSTDAQGRPLLLLAAIQDQWQNVDLLLQSGANINAVDSSGYTTIMNLAGLGDYDHVLELINKGADMTITTKTGASLARIISHNLPLSDPAQIAAKQQVIQLLAAKGIKISTSSSTQ